MLIIRSAMWFEQFFSWIRQGKKFIFMIHAKEFDQLLYNKV